MASYYLGVDGGQSSTTAMLGDESGRVLGFGRGGPCNHVKASEGREKFTRAIRECVGLACAQAELDPAKVRFASACLGFSGGPADKRAILDEILPADRTIVTTDALIALTGATAGEPGIITIAGTGSITFGRNAAGKTARAGGWGYVFGDEGAAFDLTRQALRAALRFEEGWGPKTALHGLLLEATGASDANDLLHRFYTTDFPRPKIATYARLVDQAAIDGDAVARGLLENSAQQLASFASAVRKQLFEKGEPARVAYIGGVYRSKILLDRFKMLIESERGNQCGPPVLGPAAGALIDAYRAAGLNPPLSGLPKSEK
ncbi:MAG: BadF/BadG/BcrA/BcrD ATPase family protein [Bryobacteraceae bacterium]